MALYDRTKSHALRARDNLIFAVMRDIIAAETHPSEVKSDDAIALILNEQYGIACTHKNVCNVRCWHSIPDVSIRFETLSRKLKEAEDKAKAEEKIPKKWNAIPRG